MKKARIVLTKVNINNNHFYLTSCLALFPATSIGGKNATEQAEQMLTIRLTAGEDVLTDIDGTKNIFRKRAWVGKMFKDFEAKAGDIVQIDELSESVYKVQVLHGSAA